MKFRLVRVVTFILILLLLLIAGYSRYTRDRLPPVPIKEELYPGVSYRRSIRAVPRPMVIHAVMVDTQPKNISFLVTPPDSQGNQPLKARPTSQFLTEFHVQLAINGDRFFPWWSRSPADYYPHVGDPITPFGFSASNGQVYWNGEVGPDGATPPTLYISKRNTLSISLKPDNVYSAISGERMVVEKGQLISNLDDEELAPRTALGLNRNGRYLYIVVVDGRQPFYSEGCTFRELAEILQAQGAYFAMAMDGGGSSTLVVEGEDGVPRILNSPIDNYIPGRERPVGNHLGIIVNP